MSEQLLDGPPITTITDHWHDLVTVGLLGTDRRDPPQPPPGAVAAVVADATRDTPSGRMLAAVAATVAARRAGVRPAAPVMLLVPPPADPRPMIPAAAAQRWRRLVGRWPVLEDEWMAAVRRHGWRLAPDTIVAMLQRHRHDAIRRARIDVLAGPLGPWLAEHQPQFAGVAGKRQVAPGVAVEVDPDDWVPALAVAPELLPLLDGAAAAVSAAVVEGFRSGTFGLAHRAVLVNFVARVRIDALPTLAASLGELDLEIAGAGIAHTLADLATTRHEVLRELATPGAEPPS